MRWQSLWGADKTIYCAPITFRDKHSCHSWGIPRNYSMFYTLRHQQTLGTSATSMTFMVHLVLLTCTPCHHANDINPFTPESDQCQNSPAASQEILHHTVWRTWPFIAYSDEKWLYYKFSLHHSYNRFLKGWENTLFELRSERVNLGILGI